MRTIAVIESELHDERENKRTLEALYDEALIKEDELIAELIIAQGKVLYEI